MLKYLLVCLSLFGNILSVRADLSPLPGTLPVRPVFDISDIVCSATVVSVARSGEGAATAIRTETASSKTVAHIRVLTFYKTSKPSERDLAVEYEQTISAHSVSWPILREGQTVLLFLKSVGNGVFTFSDRFIGATPFRSSVKASHEPGFDSLSHWLIGVTSSSDSEDVLNALRLLEGFDSIDQDSVSKITPLSVSRDPEIAFSALALLLKFESPHSLERLKAYLDSYERDAEPLSLVSIGTELGRIRTAGELPLIEGLSGSRFVVIRLGAMEAIRGIKDSRSVPVLVMRLDDRNLAVQYGAVITLAELLQKYDGDYAPSMFIFDKKPQYYTGLWKQWWAETGSKLYPSGANSK